MAHPCGDYLTQGNLLFDAEQPGSDGIPFDDKSGGSCVQVLDNAPRQGFPLAFTQRRDGALGKRKACSKVRQALQAQRFSSDIAQAQNAFSRSVNSSTGPSNLLRPNSST